MAGRIPACGQRLLSHFGRPLARLSNAQKEVPPKGREARRRRDDQRAPQMGQQPSHLQGLAAEGALWVAGQRPAFAKILPRARNCRTHPGALVDTPKHTNAFSCEMMSEQKAVPSETCRSRQDNSTWLRFVEKYKWEKVIELPKFRYIYPLDKKIRLKLKMLKYPKETLI